MTTSGQTIIEMNRTTLVAASLRKLGVLALGQVPSTEETTNATEALNNLVAEFQTLGMPLWAQKQTTIPMVASQGQYVIGVGMAVNTPFPLKVLQAWIVQNAGGSKQELWANAIEQFNRLPTQQMDTGTPSQYMYQPRINYGELNLWPLPDSTTVSNSVLYIEYMAPFEGFVGALDTPYFPREWNNALIYGTAALLASEYGTPLNDRGMLQKEADMHKDLALDFGLENASLMFQPMENWDRASARSWR